MSNVMHRSRSKRAIRAPASHGPDPNTDLVSVVIPARNEEESIRACLEAVLAQDYADLEVLVVDGDSDDRTRSIVEEIAHHDHRVRVLRDGARTIPTALNVGLEAARGRWLVRVDAHSTVPPTYVARAAEHLRSGRWGGVGGRKDAVGTTPTGRAIAAALGSPFGVGGSLYHHGTAMQTVEHVPFGAYPTALLKELGGWDERLLANEDFELDHRLRVGGHRLLFDPELTIAWRCRQSIPDLFRQYRRYGRGKAVVSLLHPRSLRPRHLAPPVFVALLAYVLLLRRTRASVILLGPYVAIVAAATASTGRNLEERDVRKWLPLVFPALHFGYGIGFWERLLSEVLRRIRARAGALP